MEGLGIFCLKTVLRLFLRSTQLSTFSKKKAHLFREWSSGAIVLGFL